jgi:esterase/lipase superfamily enzyme
MFWMITNRNVKNDGFGDEFDELTFWQNPTGKLQDFGSWVQFKDPNGNGQAAFRQALVAITDGFPDPATTPSEDQKHVSFFVHGFNESWSAAAERYGLIVTNLFTGASSLGECILFSWPSEGSVLGYLPDREQARKGANDFAEVLSALYDWMAMKQAQTANDPTQACRAKTSVIAHSMGNYLLENAMNFAWTRKNRPLLMSLINQLLMVAADVDNDLFRTGENVSHGDGEGIANLTYRVTALYTGRDSVLGASSGLKHFGKRRLGRSGLDLTSAIPDNVWEVDCSKLIDPKLNGIEVHGSYFTQAKCYALMRELLRGIDRSVLVSGGLVPPALVRAQKVAG